MKKKKQKKSAKNRSKPKKQQMPEQFPFSAEEIARAVVAPLKSQPAKS